MSTERSIGEIKNPQKVLHVRTMTGQYTDALQQVTNIIKKMAIVEDPYNSSQNLSNREVIARRTNNVDREPGVWEGDLIFGPVIVYDHGKKS